MIRVNGNNINDEKSHKAIPKRDDIFNTRKYVPHMMIVMKNVISVTIVIPLLGFSIIYASYILPELFIRPPSFKPRSLTPLAHFAIV